MSKFMWFSSHFDSKAAREIKAKIFKCPYRSNSLLKNNNLVLLIWMKWVFFSILLHTTSAVRVTGQGICHNSNLIHRFDLLLKANYSMLVWKYAQKKWNKVSTLSLDITNINNSRKTSFTETLVIEHNKQTNKRNITSLIKKHNIARKV